MLKVLIKKELKRVFTDRRLVFTVLIMPAVMIFIIYSIMGVAVDNMLEDINKHIGTVYIQNAPEEFVEYANKQLEELSKDQEDIEEHEAEGVMKVTYLSKSEDIERIKDDIKDGNIDLLVEFEDDFMSKVNNYQTGIKPSINTYSNSSEEYSVEIKGRFINTILYGFEQNILAERFGNIEYVKAFEIDRDNNEFDIKDDKKASGKALATILPALIVIFLFAGAMSIGVDTIAGEKERGTMATLLLTPVKREILALGKIISLGVVSIISALISFAAVIGSMPFASSFLTVGADEESFNLINLFGINDYIQFLVILLALVSIFVTIICLISVNAKTIKEANSFAMPIYFVIMIMAFSNMFTTSGTPSTLSFVVPIYGNILSLKGLLEFELTMSQFLISTGSTLTVTIILVSFIAKVFNNERVMLNA
ncbi:MAG: ABC transporter permease [Eubacteriales bacterium]